MECAIGCIKLYSILNETIPISMTRLTNQIVYVCAFLTNFQPALIPLPVDQDNEDVELYFDQLSDSYISESDEDSDTNV